MTQVIVNGELRTQLANLSESAGVYDESGRFLGWFEPIPPELRKPQVSDEELKRRANSGGPWYTTAQVLEHLRKLEEKERG